MKQKKLLALLLALAMLLALAACGKKNDQNGQTIGGADGPTDIEVSDDQKPQEPETPAEPEDSGETAEPEQPEEDKDPETQEPEQEEQEEPKEETPVQPEEKQPALSHTDVTFKAVGNHFTLSVTGMKEGAAVAFSSADESIATVDEKGVVTAVGPGTTTVSAAVDGGEALSCIIRCSWQGTQEETKPEGEQEEAGTQSSFEDFFATLKSSYDGLGMMMRYDNDSELRDNYYPGLGDVAVDQILVQETAMTTANCAVALVQVSDSADVETVKSILAARAKAQADGGAWYPASCETWKDAKIVSAGNFVGMFVHPSSAQDMADAFTAAYGG